MKFTYAYRDSSGIRHEATIEAESRDAAFAALRKDGIRPIKVVAADGSKANGAPVGVRKRVVAFLVGIAICVGVGVTVAVSRVSAPTMPHFETARRFPIGDAAVIEKGIITGWSDVFQEEGERFLASFAVPGVKAGQRSTTAGEIEAALARQIAISNDDGLEARQIKAMVEGMKQEARAYIAAGGNVVEYGKRLEKPDILECTSNAQLGDLVRCQHFDVLVFAIVLAPVHFFHLTLRMIFNYALSVELHSTVGRCVNARDNVEGSGLAGTVRSDKSDDFALVYFKIEIVNSHNAAELHSCIAYAEYVLITHCRHLLHLPFLY